MTTFDIQKTDWIRNSFLLNNDCNVTVWVLSKQTGYSIPAMFKDV